MYMHEWISKMDVIGKFALQKTFVLCNGQKGKGKREKGRGKGGGDGS